MRTLDVEFAKAEYSPELMRALRSIRKRYGIDPLTRMLSAKTKRKIVRDFLLNSGFNRRAKEEAIREAKSLVKSLVFNLVYSEVRGISIGSFGKRFGPNLPFRRRSFAASAARESQI